MYNIHLLPASFGDSILIEYGKTKPYYILIDGGPYFAFEDMITGLRKVAPKLKTIELLVITHVDIDHIDGTINLLNQKKLPFKINEVWFNGYEQLEKAEDMLGGLQGEYASHLIKTKEFNHNTFFKKGPVVITDEANLPVIPVRGGMKLTLINPRPKALSRLRKVWKKEIDKIGDEAEILRRFAEDHRYDEEISDLLGEETIEELQKDLITGDKSEANASSIAFIGTYGKKSCLFAADAPTDDIIDLVDHLIEEQGGDRLKLDAWKLAHHGSKKSTLAKLMQKIDCKRMLISSDGKMYKHPDPQTIARMIKHNGPDVHFYFNYLSDHNKRWNREADQEKYRFQSHYPEAGAAGITLKLSK
jgi:beta-lactamase superfamily II metal-dependent hydrolase